ncbi:DUF2797 domain-containing protein [Granulosicoccaceae sp. 1_MG-2023]|nr:DUF2797 domain-containing protein [Granulosicoccaceae sp. 1_MG-2023]
MRGNLEKMTASLQDTVQYALPVGEHAVPLNELLGQRLSLHFTGAIHCCACGRKTRKSYSQGHCYPCMKSLARCDMCILKPETCHFDQGTCREPEWGQSHCLVPHYVYLANTSGIKVGITRHSQIPTRWIDQGAVQATPVYKVASRRISGEVEVAIAGFMADKTNWRALLKGEPEKIDLAARLAGVRDEIAGRLDGIAAQFGAQAVTAVDEPVTEINYPVLEYPGKIVSHNFDKNPDVSGILLGIKGQYLIFDTGVINVRKYTGYEVELDF